VIVAFGVFAFLAGASVALAWLALETRDQCKRTCFDMVHVAHKEASLNYREMKLAQEEASKIRDQMAAQNKAIEASALPWFAKNDKLEARFEADALDKLDNPEVSYQDVVSGLGGTN
jgi:hypothetical protein